MSPAFGAMYADGGRPSIAPERLLKASLLIALYSVRSERLFCEQLAYNMLFRWFLDMDLEARAFDHSTFSLNRSRLIAHDIARTFFAGIVKQARAQRLLSDEHFTVDGTLIEAWASFKSFKRKAGEPPRSGGDGTGRNLRDRPQIQYMYWHYECCNRGLSLRFVTNLSSRRRRRRTVS